MKTCLFFLVLCCTAAANAQTVGVQLYSFRNQFAKDVPGTVSIIKGMGITEAEGGDSYGMKPGAFKQLLSDNGIRVVSVGADFKQLTENPQAIIDNAKLYGAAYVVCFWIPHDNKKGFTKADADKGIEVFNTAGKMLKENGLSLCYHPHGYEFRTYGDATLFDYMMQKMDPAYANFEMDVFWIKHPGQDPVALLEKYKGRFKLMHLKDRKPGTPGNLNGQADVESNVVLGSGDVGIAAIMKAAKKAGVEHYFIEDESSRSVEQVPQSLLFIKNLR